MFDKLLQPEAILQKKTFGDRAAHEELAAPPDLLPGFKGGGLFRGREGKAEKGQRGDRRDHSSLPPFPGFATVD